MDVQREEGENEAAGKRERGGFCWVAAYCARRHTPGTVRGYFAGAGVGVPWAGDVRDQELGSGGSRKEQGAECALVWTSAVEGSGGGVYTVRGVPCPQSAQRAPVVNSSSTAVHWTQSHLLRCPATQLRVCIVPGRKTHRGRQSSIAAAGKLGWTSPAAPAEWLARRRHGGRGGMRVKAAGTTRRPPRAHLPVRAAHPLPAGRGES